MTAFMIIGSVSGAESMEDMYSVDASQIHSFQQEDQQIYGKGTYMEITAKRIGDYISSFFNMILFFPQILGTFLLGAYFAKRKWLEDIHHNRQFSRKTRMDRRYYWHRIHHSESCNGFFQYFIGYWKCFYRCSIAHAFVRRFLLASFHKPS